jgi:hypothetical protein
MACPTSTNLVHGNLISNSHSPTKTSQPPFSRPAPPSLSNPLEQLTQLMLSNDNLMDELTVSRAKIVSARSYLDRPGCNVGFGSAHLERCRSKHSGVLAQLRANRIEALHLLGHVGSDD